MQTEDTLTQLAAHVQKALNLDTVNPDVAIGELGFDSMRVVELILICDQLYDTPINPEAIDLNQYTTLRDLDRMFQSMARKKEGLAATPAASEAV